MRPIYSPLSVSFSTHRQGDGQWVVTEDTHFIDRRGEKDDDSEQLAWFDDEADARAEVARLQQRRAA